MNEYRVIDIALPIVEVIQLFVARMVMVKELTVYNTANPFLTPRPVIVKLLFLDFVMIFLYPCLLCYFLFDQVFLILIN